MAKFLQNGSYFYQFLAINFSIGVKYFNLNRQPILDTKIRSLFGNFPFTVRIKNNGSNLKAHSSVYSLDIKIVNL